MADEGVSTATKAALAATVAPSVMIAQQVASRATRDALFLTSHSVRTLPAMVLIGAALSLVSVVVATRLMGRFGPSRAAPAAFALNGALFGVDYLLSHVDPRTAAIVLYLHVALTGATVISMFWSLISERFDPHTCKRYIARIGAGGTAGGIVGGILAWNASVLLSVRSNLAIMGFMNVLCVFAAMRIAHRPAVAQTTIKEPEPEPTMQVLRASGYLRMLAALVGLVALSEALLDWVFNASAAARYHSGGELIRFFAIFHTVTALVTFALQMGLARRALQKVGPAGTIALLPISLVVGGALGFMSPTFARIVGLRSGEAAISNSLFRSGYELFYTPLASEKKRSTKTVIDVGFDRIGTFLGGGLTMIALHLGKTKPMPILLATSVGVGMLVLILSRLLQRGYVKALADSLKSDAAQVTEAAHVPGIPEPPPSLSTTGTRESIAAARPSGNLGAAPAIPIPKRARRTGDELVEDFRALISGRPERVQPIFTRAPLDPRLVAHVVPLLANEALAVPALRALRAISAQVVGTMGDALLDPDESIDVRRRLPIALRTAPTQRACDVLLLALADPSFEVRYQVGIALVHLTQRAPSLRIDEAPVIAAILREVEADKATWESRLELAPEEDDDEFLMMDAYLRMRTSRGLQFIFALLSLILDREPIQLAFRALSTGDEDLRGTALEYLENVLPEPVHDALWPFLGDHRAFRPPRRERATVVQQLVDRGEAIAAILEAMRKQNKVPRTSQQSMAPSAADLSPPRASGM